MANVPFPRKQQLLFLSLREMGRPPHLADFRSEQKAELLGTTAAGARRAVDPHVDVLLDVAEDDHRLVLFRTVGRRLFDQVVIIPWSGTGDPRTKNKDGGKQ